VQVCAAPLVILLVSAPPDRVIVMAESIRREMKIAPAP
jgi:hypothetical protein